MSSFYSLKNTEMASLSESHIVALSSQKRMMEEKQNKLLQDLENKTISRELLLTNKLQEFIVKEEAHGKGKKNRNIEFFIRRIFLLILQPLSFSIFPLTFIFYFIFNYFIISSTLPFLLIIFP